MLNPERVSIWFRSYVQPPILVQPCNVKSAPVRHNYCVTTGLFRSTARPFPSVYLCRMQNWTKRQENACQPYALTIERNHGCTNENLELFRICPWWKDRFRSVSRWLNARVPFDHVWRLSTLSFGTATGNREISFALATSLALSHTISIIQGYRLVKGYRYLLTRETLCTNYIKREDIPFELK